MKFSHFFINRPIFAAVLSIVTVIVGAIAAFTLPISQYPEVTPPTVVVTAHYPGANPAVVAETVATPIEEQVNGVENMLYMSSQCTSDGNDDADHHLQARHRSQHRAGAGAKPGRHRPAAASRRTCATSASRPPSASPTCSMVVHLVSPDGSHDAALHEQLRAPPGARHPGALAGRGRRAGVRRAGVFHAHLARPRQDRRLQHDGDGCRQRHPRAERAGGRGHHRPAARAQRARRSSN